MIKCELEAVPVLHIKEINSAHELLFSENKQADCKRYLKIK